MFNGKNHYFHGHVPYKSPFSHGFPMVFPWFSHGLLRISTAPPVTPVRQVVPTVVPTVTPKIAAETTAEVRPGGFGCRIPGFSKKWLCLKIV